MTALASRYVPRRTAAGAAIAKAMVLQAPIAARTSHRAPMTGMIVLGMLSSMGHGWVRTGGQVVFSPVGGGFRDFDVFFRCRGFGDGHRDSQDAVGVGGFDVVFLGAGGQGHGSVEAAVVEFGSGAFLVLFGAFGFDRHLSVADADVDVFGGVDSGEFGAQGVAALVEVFLDADHVAFEGGPGGASLESGHEVGPVRQGREQGLVWAAGGTECS